MGARPKIGLEKDERGGLELVIECTRCATVSNYTLRGMAEGTILKCRCGEEVALLEGDFDALQKLSDVERSEATDAVVEELVERIKVSGPSTSD